MQVIKIEHTEINFSSVEYTKKKKRLEILYSISKYIYIVGLLVIFQSSLMKVYI